MVFRRVLFRSSIAVVGIDGLVIGGVVAVVAGRGEDRHQPERVDAKVVEIVEARDQAGEVALPVSVGVLKAAHEDFVEDGAARPALQRSIGGSRRRFGSGASDEEEQEGQAHGARVYRLPWSGVLSARRACRCRRWDWAQAASAGRSNRRPTSTGSSAARST